MHFTFSISKAEIFVFVENHKSRIRAKRGDMRKVLASSVVIRALERKRRENGKGFEGK